MFACPWDIDVEACCQDTGFDPGVPADMAKIESVIEQVSEMLSRWSGYRYGGCRTLRPVDPCGECRSGCCFQGDCILINDAESVLAVRMDGIEVDPAEWHFDAARGILCAVAPLQWPTRDPRSSDVPTIEVDVSVGEEPDAWALAVASELACELLRSCAGKKCRLPSNVTSVTSQGVTVTLSQDELIHSIPSVIAWVHAVNPAAATAPSRIFSPEARKARVGTPRFRRF